MRLRASTSPIGPGRGLGAASPALARWTPASLGSSLAFALRADKVGVTARTTRSGANILTLANDGGTAASMSSSAGQYCTVDETVSLGAYGAIRTSSTSCNLNVASGGPTGAAPWTMLALVRQVAQPASQNTTYMLLGPCDGSATNRGIGSTTPGNGTGLFVAGQGSAPYIVGANGTFDTGPRLIEVVNDGAGLTLRRNGGKLGTAAAGVTTLGTGGMGLRGFYPAASYGTPDTRVYGAWWINGTLAPAQYASLLRYIHAEYAWTPYRFVDVLGDSRSQGHIGGTNTTSYVELMQTQYAALATPEIVDVRNDGISGETTTQILARVTPDYLDHLPNAALGGRTAVILRGITNDGTISLVASQSYANLVAASVLIRARGLRTIISTEHNTTTSNATNRANLATFNSLCLAGVGTDFDGCADIRGLIANYATTNPTTTDLPDGVHQSDALLASEATIYRATMNALP